MPTFWGMNPDQLYGAGGNISSLETDATAATNGFKGAIESASGAVFHPTVSGALDTFWQNHAQLANGLPVNVNAAGSQVQGSAVDGVQGDQQTASDQAPARGASEALNTTVPRPINY